jgi:polyisoprenyl-phosphate glycosyltransferase
MPVDLSVVIAVYNEDPRNLIAVLDRLEQAVVALAITYEVVFVNDGSRQPTSEALYQIADKHDHVKLVVLSRNFGQQAAISAGFDHCCGETIVNLDSDGQDPPELIPEMLRLWKSGYDVVYAQRSTRKDRLTKKLSAFLFYRILAMVSSVKIPWDTGDFRLVDRRVVEALNNMPEKSRFLRGQIPWLGFKQIGIPIERGARELGESTYTLRKLISLAMDGLLGFSVMPLYLVAPAGALVFAGGILLFLACLLMCLSRQAVPGPLWIGATLATLTGLQIMVMGILSAYLAKVLDEVRARPTYVVAERIGLPFAREGKWDAPEECNSQERTAKDTPAPPIGRAPRRDGFSVGQSP